MTAAPALTLNQQQWPTRDPMGQNAVRWQADVRAGVRAREHGNAHRPGLLTTARHPGALSVRSTFAPVNAEHDTPKRDRAYWPPMRLRR
jgi:hypothetical protein